MNVFSSLAEKPQMLRPPVVPKRRNPPVKRFVRPPALPNPWGMTGIECRTMEAVTRLGKSRDVGAELGLSFKTVEEHVRQIKKKMGVSDRTVAAVAYDRFIRGAALPATKGGN